MPETLNLLQQENLLALLAHSDEHGKLVAQIANPNLFEGDYRIIAQRCIDYWRRHGQAPKVHTADILEDQLQGRKGQTYRRILLAMAQLNTDGINAQYVIDGLKKQTRSGEIKVAIQKAAEEISRSQETSIERTEEILADLLRARDFHFDPGERLYDIDPLLEWLENYGKEFSTGIKELDSRFIVPHRKTVFLVIGGANRGKSWCLMNIGKKALLKRKKVLHISLEMDTQEVKLRYLQSLFSATKRESEADITKLELNRDGSLKSFKRDQVRPDFRFSDHEIKLELTSRIRQWGYQTFGNLIIKKFPTRGLTISQLRAYLDGLEATENFIPDMVILDYIGIMKLDEKNFRISLATTAEDFRGLMDERNMAGVIAQQLSKEGEKAMFANLTHIAEAWALAGTIDNAIAYSATDSEQRFGLGRILVIKARSEESKFPVLITQSYRTGQFVIESMPLRMIDYEESFQRIAVRDPMAQRREEEDDNDDPESD